MMEFSIQEIIDNQTAIVSLKKELEELLYSVNYDVIHESQHEMVKRNLKILQENLEAEEIISLKINSMLSKQKIT